MNLKEIGLFIDMEISKNYKSRAKFSRETGRVKQRTNEFLNNIKRDKKNFKFDKLEDILKDLGYELILDIREIRTK